MTNTEQKVLDAENAWGRALAANDVAALDTLMTDNLRYTHANSLVETKREFLDKIRSGERRYLSLEFFDLEVCIAGAAAIVNGCWRVVVRIKDHDIEARVRYTHIYLNENDAWRLLAHHASHIPAT